MFCFSRNRGTSLGDENAQTALARLAELAYDGNAVLTNSTGRNMNTDKLAARRNFLSFLAGSPVLASLPALPGFGDEVDLEQAALSHKHGDLARPQRAGKSSVRLPPDADGPTNCSDNIASNG